MRILFFLMGWFAGIVTAGLAAYVGHWFGEAAQARARTDLHQLAALAQQFREQEGSCPQTFADLEAAGVLAQEPIDPWGQPYRMLRCGSISVVSSWGFDHAPGGDGDAADSYFEFPCD